MSEQLMTPAEIERATVVRCAKVAAWQHDGFSAAEEIRALPPMFGDVPAGWQLVPDGWSIKRDSDLIIVRKDGVGGYVAQQNTDNIASEILYWLADSLLAAAPTADVRGEDWMNELEQLRAQCAELEDRLEEIRKQEPVAEVVDAVQSPGYFYVKKLKHTNAGTKLYAAPTAGQTVANGGS